MKFRTAWPGVHLRTYAVPAVVIAEMLMRGEADIGVAMNDTPTPTLETEVIGWSEVVCVLPDRHRLARRAKIQLADLEGETVISYRNDSLQTTLIDRAIGKEGGKLRPDVEIDVSIAALSFVRQGLGIALVDGLLPWRSFSGLTVRPFRPAVALPLCLLTSLRRPLSRHQQTLRQELRDAARAYAADNRKDGVLQAA